MEEEIHKMDSNNSMFMNMTKENCKENCTNEVCLGPEDYEYYLSFVKVDDFEMVFVILNVIVFLTGIMGNLLVSMTGISIFDVLYFLKMGPNFDGPYQTYGCFYRPLAYSPLNSATLIAFKVRSL